MNLENKEGWERMELHEAQRNVKTIEEMAKKADKLQEHYESMRAWERAETNSSSFKANNY